MFPHRRSASADTHVYPPPRSPSPPSIIHHPQILPHAIPTTSLVESMAGAAHYSGAKVDSGMAHQRRKSFTANELHTDLKDQHARVMNDLTELYCCRPTAEIFEKTWRKDATFEDPLTTCKGYDEYAAQPKLFSKSVNISTRVMSSTLSPNRLVYYQVQEYTARFLGYKKIIESIIVVDLDEEGKIMHMTDQWQGQEPRWCGSFLRTFSAKITPWFVRVPKFAP
ncbi:hypothetical protein AN958_02375 [Leucoagaricus sp. SymC.cos]|nr:hypothetical protein AN958_02375 [Leucoagaricus sp. SymC.cos]